MFLQNIEHLIMFQLQEEKLKPSVNQVLINLVILISNLPIFGRIYGSIQNITQMNCYVLNWKTKHKGHTKKILALENNTSHNLTANHSDKMNTSFYHRVINNSNIIFTNSDLMLLEKIKTNLIMSLMVGLKNQPQKWILPLT